MKEIKKQVEFILRGYTAMKREVKALEFELERFKPNVHSEVIKNLTFSHSARERVSGSVRSDKTANIAIDHYDSQINGEYHALRTLIGNMQIELTRLDYYLSLLPEKEAIVIKMFYLEGLTWEQIAERTLWAPRSLQRYKGKGLAQLTKFFAALDSIDLKNLNIRAKVRFVSYIHEERFTECLNRADSHREPGVEALLYLVSGCNELWNAGAETFFDFKTGATISYKDTERVFTGNGKELLRLGYHFANGFDRTDLLHTLQGFFPGLEYIHLELAIEAIKLALSSGICP